MRILHLSTSDMQGGAARAAYRLHDALRAEGVDSRMLVRLRLSHDEHVYAYPDTPLPGKAGETHRTVKNVWSKVRNRLRTWPYRHERARASSMWTDAGVPYGIAQKVNTLKPDVVHLHWIGREFLPVESFRHIQAPIVWTLRDMWSFTGGCHYTGMCDRFRQACGHCPQLASNRENDLSRFNFQRKAAAWQGLTLHIVGLSHWVAQQASESTLLGHQPVQVIPNCIDLERFQPRPQAEARAAFGLPQDKFILLFGAMDVSDERKGAAYLIDALKQLADKNHDVELAVFGDTGQDTAAYDVGLPVHFMGRITDDDTLARLYSAADLMVAPSIQENLSNAVIESLSCGTPCIAFDIGGMPDMIKHQVNGYLVPQVSAGALAEGLAWTLANHQLLPEMGQRARENALRAFSRSDVARQYQQLYQSILNQ